MHSLTMLHCAESDGGGWGGIQSNTNSDCVSIVLPYLCLDALLKKEKSKETKEEEENTIGIFKLNCW